MNKDNLETKFPHIASQWDETKNLVYPKDVKPYSNKKAWFLCEKNHSYETVISRRTTRNTGCPYCSSRKVGYGNDLETNFPLIADERDILRRIFFIFIPIQRKNYIFRSRKPCTPPTKSTISDNVFSAQRHNV